MRHIASLLIVVLSFAAFSAHAQIDMLSTDHNQIVAELSSVDQQIRAVRLIDNGQLVVSRYDGSSRLMILSEYNRSAMLNMAKSLAEARIVEEHRFVICEIYVLPWTIQNLYVGDSDSGSLKMVLSPSSCAFEVYYHPADQYYLEIAKSLKAQLVALAHEAR